MINDKNDLKTLMMTLTKSDWAGIDHAKNIALEPSAEDIRFRLENEKTRFISLINQFSNTVLSSDPGITEIKSVLSGWVEANRERLAEYIGDRARIDSFRDNLISKVSDSGDDIAGALKILYSIIERYRKR